MAIQADTLYNKRPDINWRTAHCLCEQQGIPGKWFEFIRKLWVNREETLGFQIQKGWWGWHLLNNSEFILELRACTSKRKLLSASHPAGAATVSKPTRKIWQFLFYTRCHSDATRVQTCSLRITCLQHWPPIKT